LCISKKEEMEHTHNISDNSLKKLENSRHEIFLSQGSLHGESVLLSDSQKLETEEVLAENVLGSFDSKGRYNTTIDHDISQLQHLQQDLVQLQPDSHLSGSTMVELKSLHMVVRLADISPHDAFEMLMDSDKHAQFTGQEAKIGREINTEFSAYDGHITGSNIELQKDRRIVQKWRAKDWVEGHYSMVTILFRKVANGTKVTLTQSGVPADKFSFIWEGWYNFYWNKMGRVDEKELKKNKRQKVEPTRLYSEGTPILHVEIPCKDMERVMKFYGNVFGWTFKPWTPYYTLFNTRGKPGSITGGFWLNDKDDIPRERFITLYIHVDDISDYLKVIEEHGGEIIRDKAIAPESVGYYAFFRDTEGNQMGLNAKS